MEAAQAKTRRSLALFSLICLGLLTIYCVQFPSLTIHPEPYGETGTDFYYQARYLGPWENLWASHGGYLPWLQRVVALAAVKILHLHELFASGVQYFALIFVVCSCALLCLEPFQRVSSSVTVRVLLALTIGVLPEYNLYSYVNFAYFGIIFVLFMLLRKDGHRSALSDSPLFVLLALVGCAKTFFIVFLPVFLGRVAWDWHRGERTRAMLWILPIASQLCQVSFMFINRGLYTSDPAVNLTFLQRALQGVYFSFYSFGNVFIQNRSIVDLPSAGSLIAFSFAGVLLVVVALVVCVTRRDWKQAGWIVLLVGLAGASLFLSTIMMPIREIDWKQPAFLDQGRWFLFGYVLILLCLFSSLNVFLRGRVVTVVCAGYLLLTSWGSVGRMKDIFADERDSFSQWGRYSPLLSKEAYCIPLNPYPWLLGRQCHYLDEVGTDLTSFLSESGSIAASAVSRRAETRALFGAVVTLPEPIARSAMLSVRALKKDGGVVIDATEISAPGSVHRYFLFDQPVDQWEQLTFATNRSEPGLPLGSKLRILGAYP